MPVFRDEIASLTPYEIGRPIEEVVREHGIDPSQVVKLAANESSDGPFPGVVEAVTTALARSNRYPDNDPWDLGFALADRLGVDRSNLLFGNGSVALLAEVASALGGPGTTAVYGWPSFVMYRFVSVWAGSRFVEVPLDESHSLDLDAIAAAIDERTRVVYLCNPNNPTGTLKPTDDLVAFIDSVPDRVMVVIDEAYHEYVTDPGYRTLVPLAVERDNVLVARTFSKIYSLAAHRIGYLVGHRDTITEVRKAQAPLTVNQPAQAAALASLGQPDEVARRVASNAAGRHHLHGVMAERGLPHVESQANFVYFKMPGDDSRRPESEFLRRGVIVRPMSRGWMRVTVGSEPEVERFVSVLDEVLQTAPN